MIWGRKSSKRLQTLIEAHENEYVKLDKAIRLSSSLEEALAFSQYIVISISAQALRTLCRDLSKYDLKGKTIILAMKGLEKSTGNRLSQVVGEELGSQVNLAVWVGPSHAEDLTKGIPNCMLICSDEEDLSKEIVDLFSSKLLRLYRGHDMVGTEIGAAAKNVMGLAAGMLDGLGYSSLKGALMARGSREIARLIQAMGGEEITAYGLSHIGDYEATLFSQHSNNRRYGENFVLKKDFGKLAEGVSTMHSLILLAKDKGVALPITEAVYSIIIHGKEPIQVMEELFLRVTKNEYQSID